MPRKKEQTFEEKLSRLRALVETLENGNMPLKETFDAYEEGVALSKELETMLLEGEKRIEQMLAGGNTQDISGDIAEAKEG